MVPHRLSVITKFTKADMDILRKTIIQEPHHFLLLPRSKQTLLVDKMVERMVSGSVGGFKENKKPND